jgi:hypothetical protein
MAAVDKFGHDVVGDGCGCCDAFFADGCRVGLY